MVLGVREVGKDMPLKSRLGNQITRTVFRLLSGVKVTDTQTGLRAFGMELLDKLIGVITFADFIFVDIYFRKF